MNVLERDVAMGGILVKTSPGALLDHGDDTDALALVSVFGNIDDAGDVVAEGAFGKDLERNGDVRAVFWSHRTSDVTNLVGVAKLEEVFAGDPRLPADLQDHGGLLAAVKFHQTTDASRAAKAAVKDASGLGWSFSYEVRRWRPDVIGGRKVQVLQELDVHEVGPCLVGMNRLARTVAAKSAGDAEDVAARARRALLVKQGRRIRGQLVLGRLGVR